MNRREALSLAYCGKVDIKDANWLRVRRKCVRRSVWPPGKYVSYDPDAYLVYFKGRGLGNSGHFMLHDPEYKHPKPFTFDILEHSMYSTRFHGLRGEYVALALEACQETEEDRRATDWEVMF